MFDLLAVLAVEIFAVVFPALPQAEKSNANDAMLNMEKVAVFEILIFSLSEAGVSISRCDFEEQMDCMFNSEFQSRFFNLFSII